jgi:putative zinc finger/helix-turn-helix YgiT family protein
VTEKFECLECGKFITPGVEQRTETLPVRGEPTDVLARVAVCPECGADMSIEELDDATLVAAFNLYRQKHGLMTPEEMKRLRERYGLGVRAFSLLLGWGEITLHRYEAGSLQDGAHEAALRMAEDPANIRVYLTANGHKLTTRQRARLEAHLQAAEAGDRAACAPGLDDRFVVREERDAYGGWVPLQLSKLREMMLFFAQLPEMYQTKLNKLLFYADFGFFRDSGVSITGSPYLAFQHGPVPQHYPWIEADLIEGGDMTSEDVFFSGGGSGVVLRTQRTPYMSVFSSEEIAMMQLVAERLGGKTSRRLKDLSHRERAWVDTPKGEMIPYELARDLTL